MGEAMTQCVLTGIAELLTMSPTPGEAEGHAGLGLIENAAIVVNNARIAWVGPESELNAPLTATRVDLGGKVVLPGLVDAHTHLVFAGDRTHDFEARCRGESYEDVAKRGGGIQLTVNATREASEEALLALARPRMRDLLAHGVTTVEIKSGYGLTVRDELKMLRVIDRLRREGPMRVESTLLGAHIVPGEHRRDRDRYVRLVTDELMPEAMSGGLARFVDVFCDEGAFTLAETRRILERGHELGFELKVHAEQLTRTGAAMQAAELGAVSVDHLEQASIEDVEALARSGTAAVLLPGAGLFLGAKERPPTRQLLDMGVPIALATDCNPGTCPSRNLSLIVTLGCCWLGMTPVEALRAVTWGGAQALALGDGRGQVIVDGPCDLAVIDAPSWRHIPYQLGMNLVTQVWIGGQRVWQAANNEH